MKKKSSDPELVDKLVDYINKYLRIRRLGGNEDEYIRNELRLQKILNRFESQSKPARRSRNDRYSRR
jgi:hypothetical protein